jgi:uncharacterized protein YcfL
MWRFLFFLIAFFLARCDYAPAMTFEEAKLWLEGEALRVAKGSILSAHDGTILYTPDGSAHYRALWTRDFYYLLEGCPQAVSLEEAEACFRYLIRGQREDGAMPDRVQADGLAVYLPGPVGQGIGNLPAMDNPAFMVKLVYLIGTIQGNWSLYEEFREGLQKGLDFPKKNPEGLLWIDPQNPHSPYGFTDTIFKTGALLFSSILQWEAYRAVAEMESETGHSSRSTDYAKRADQIKAALQVFWNDREGMFHAATQDCNQIDIWGSAYAVYSGLANEEQAKRIAAYLRAHHAALMQKGQLRHCAPGEYWQRGLTPKDQYQNGGHWATPFGWWFVTVHAIDPELARRTFIELVEDFQERGIHEWVLGNRFAVPDYVASACQPLAGLDRLGP